MATTEFNFLDKIIARWRYGKVKPYLSLSSRMLDFGCGEGAFLLSLTDFIQAGDGYDLDIKNQSLNDKVKLYCLDMDYKTLQKNKKKYDLITLMAVIEHIAPNKVNDMMRILTDKLKPQGYIFLTTPTVYGKIVLEFMAFKLKIISQAQILDHKKYYRREDFEKLAKVTGLNLTQYKYFQFGLNSMIVLQKE